MAVTRAVEFPWISFGRFSSGRCTFCSKWQIKKPWTTHTSKCPSIPPRGRTVATLSAALNQPASVAHRERAATDGALCSRNGFSYQRYRERLTEDRGACARSIYVKPKVGLLAQEYRLRLKRP